MEDFKLYPGEVCTLAGPNGCGKTTLAKLLCGLYSPDKGIINLSGTGGKPTAIPTKLRTSVAYVFQNPDYQIFLPTVQEELAYGLKEKGMKPKEIEIRINEAIRLFRQPALDTPPSLMSYGTRKRLQAAVYWLLERPIAILDEADSGLSFKDFSEIIHLFKRSSRTLLIITHNEAVARQFSERIILMKEGHIVREESETFFSGGGEQ